MKIVGVVLHGDLLPARAVHENVVLFLGQVLDGRIEVDAVVLRHRLHVHVVGLLALQKPAAHVDRALAQRLVFIGADERLVHDLLETQPRTLGAGAVGRIEGEQPRLDLLDADAAVGAGVLYGEELFLAVAVDDDKPVRKAERRLKAVRQAFLNAVFDDQPVHHDGDIVFEIFIEPDLLL